MVSAEPQVPACSPWPSASTTVARLRTSTLVPIKLRFTQEEDIYETPSIP
jgi:hypothetical protein